MNRPLLTIALLSAISLVACSPDFYAEQAIDAARDEEARVLRQKDEERWRRVEEKLGIEVPDESRATQESLATAFSEDSFPRETCGDPLPQDKSLYPLTYYPVFIPNEGSNLREVKSRFCSDAYAKKDGDGNDVIQVASFYTEKTSEFLLLMENNFDGVRLGSATTVNSRN